MYKLPVIRIFTEAFLLPFYNKQYYSSTLAVPTLILVGIVAAFQLISPPGQLLGWIFYLLYFIGFAIFAITCHRLILIHDSIWNSHSIIHTIRRITTFLIWLILLYAIIVAIDIVFFTLGSSIIWMIYNKPDNFDNVKVIFSIPGKYILGRLCLTLPAAAIDIKQSLYWSWKITSNNGIRMLIIIGIIPWIFQLLVTMIWRTDATLVEQTLLGLLAYFLMAIEIFALSLTYKAYNTQQPE